MLLLLIIFVLNIFRQGITFRKNTVIQCSPVFLCCQGQYIWAPFWQPIHSGAIIILVRCIVYIAHHYNAITFPTQLVNKVVSSVLLLILLILLVLLILLKLSAQPYGQPNAKYVHFCTYTRYLMCTQDHHILVCIYNLVLIK